MKLTQPKLHINGRLKLLLIVLVVLFFRGKSVQALTPTILTQGDIAIVGINTDDPDEFAFVLLTNVGSGTQINFTDNGWLASGGFRPGEGSVTWTAATDLCAGTVINTSVGTMLFSASGDQILAYQGAASSPTFVYALNDEGAGVWQANATNSNTSALPTGLVNGTTAVAIDEIDNAVYIGITSGTRAALLAAISNKANWSSDDINRQTMPTGPFVVTDAAPCGTVDVAPSVLSTTPANAATNVALTADITVTFSEDVTLDAAWYNVSCDTSGTHTAVVTGGPLNWTINPNTNFVGGESCMVTIDDLSVHDVDGDDPPDTMTADYVFSFTTVSGGFGTCGDDTETRIHTIQGSGAASAHDGLVRVIEGVVVGDFQGATGLNGFFVQEETGDQDGDPLTSEGIFVYAPSSIAVAMGDVVRVQGTVDEYFNLTELTSVTNVEVCNSGASVAAASVSLPFSDGTYLERYEGMFVTLPQTLYVTENYFLGRGGYLIMSLADRQYQPTHVALPGAPANGVAAANLLSRIIIDDGTQAQNPDPIVFPAPGLTASNTVRSGYTAANITGVLSYHYDGWSGTADNYRIHVTTPPAFSPANSRTTEPSATNGTVTVASFNVLNYFNGNGSGGGFPTARGAESLTEFNRQRDKIIAAISAMEADVIGLMELENDYPTGALSAIQDLVNGLNAEPGSPGTYSYVNPGVLLGSDEIAVGLIYRSDIVTLVGSWATDSTDAFADRNRQPLAQTFEVITTGERFTVVVNHLKSKGSDCNDGTVNDPDNVFPDDPDTGDGQGNCNLTRTIAVNQMLTWLATNPTGAGDGRFLIVGDLNAYRLENPITTFTSNGYTNLTDTFLGSNAYSYVFGGQSGYLDHALASPAMLPVVSGVTEWHINTDEPSVLDYNTNYKTAGQIISLYSDDVYRSADHDPVLIGLYPYDFSDLAGSYGTAWHTGGGALRLGTTWTADRTFGNNSDNGSDDGIARLPGAWIPGATVTIRATVTRSSGAAPAWLSCWIDWDNNGVFAAATERAVNTAVVVGVNDINLTIPLSTPSFTTLATRCRLYDSATEPFGPLATASSGAGTGGEVEDYNWGFSTTAITLSEMQVGNAAAPLRLFLVVLLLVVGNLWSWRRHIRLNNRTNQS
ncbi:MAG: ExeM/NucH family extracellular endonuclease [Candidatus Promineifilaceae bacterium]